MNLTEQQIHLLLDNDILHLDDPEAQVSVDDAIESMMDIIHAQEAQIEAFEVKAEVFTHFYQKASYTLLDAVLALGKTEIEILNLLKNKHWIIESAPTPHAVGMGYLLAEEELIFTQEGFNTLALIIINTRN